MFYSHYVLTKKGPLGKVWIAATLGESRIPKSFASTANIHILCEDIEKPASPFALRLSASLMLGVVRVYSRKSNIILSDVTTIFQMLSRQHPSKRLLSKRSRADYETGGVVDGDNISLSGTRGLADIDTITLGGGRRNGHTDGITGGRGRGRGRTMTRSNVGVGGERASSIYDFQDSNHDLFFSTMHNIFLSNSQDVTQSFTNELHLHTPFFAREEDITMKPYLSSDSNGNSFQFDHHSDEFMPFIAINSQESVQQSPGTIRKTLLFEEEQHQQSPLLLTSHVALPFDPSSTRPGETNTRTEDDGLGRSGRDGDGTLQVTNNDGKTGDDKRISEMNLEHMFTAVDMQPLELSNINNVSVQEHQQQRQQRIVEDVGREHSRTGSPSGNVEKRSILQSVTTGAHHVPLIEEEEAEEEEEEDDEREGKEQQREKNRKRRKIRGHGIILDGITELNNYQFRNQLEDTSDIVFSENEDRMFIRRVRKGVHGGIGIRRGKMVSHPVLTGEQIPGYMETFNPEIQLMWKANFKVNTDEDNSKKKNNHAAAEDENESRETATLPAPLQSQPQYSIPIADGQFLDEDIIKPEGTTPEQMRMAKTNTADHTHRQTTGGQFIDNIVPDAIPAEVDGPEMNRSVPLFRAGLNNSGSGSVGLAMGASAEGGSDFGNSRSLSGSLMSSGRGRRMNENARDRLFNLITPDDRKSYEQAREIASRMRENLLATTTDTDDSGRRTRRRLGSTDAIPLPMPLESGSEHSGTARRTNTPGSGDDDLERHVRLNTSDYELIEETPGNNEDDADTDEEALRRAHGRVDAIGIRAYKMLCLLRGKSTNNNNEDVEKRTTSFGELMEGCSRGVHAKGFYHLLSLVNHQFVKVSQACAYDTIYIQPGIYF